MIAWYPDKIAAPAELTAVLVKPGQVSRAQWVEALSDRVSSLALKEENPLEAANLACQMLDLPPVENPNQLGDALVRYNLDLLTNLNVADNNQFPVKAAPKEEAKQALKEVDLQSWVELALSQVNESDLA